MKIKMPLVWVGEIMDADGNTVPPWAIIDRLSVYDDLVRALELLNHYRSPDIPAIALNDVDVTLLRVQAIASHEEAQTAISNAQRKK